MSTTVTGTSWATMPPAWRQPLAVLALAVLAVLLVYGGTASAMVGIWYRSETFTHAFLVPPISAWLVWRDRARLVGLVPTPAPVWLIPIGLSALAWLLGDLAAVNAVTQLALVTMLVCLVPLVLGRDVAGRMVFPLAFLYFCVPVGEFLLPVFMDWTADFTVAALRVSGIPVYREGLHFVIPSGNWSVVEACSGVRYLIASLMVGSLFAYLNYQSTLRRWVFVGVSIAVPIVANWLRAYIIVMLGHLSNNRIATGVDHLVYGWVFFGIVIAIMFAIGIRWAEPEPEPVPATGGASDDGGARRLPGWMPVLLAVSMAGASQAAALVAHRNVSTADVKLAFPAATAAGWTASPQMPLQPRFLGGANPVEAAFRMPDDRVVHLSLTYYRDQGAERKVSSSVNMLVLASDHQWSILGQSRVEAALGGEGQSAWQRTHLVRRSGASTAPARHLTVWQSYWVDDHLVAGPIEARARGAWGLLSGRGDDAALVVAYTDAAPDAGGQATLERFVREQMPAVLAALRAERTRGRPTN